MAKGTSLIHSCLPHTYLNFQRVSTLVQPIEKENYLGSDTVHTVSKPSNYRQKNHRETTLKCPLGIMLSATHKSNYLGT
jgi:hypothetical protein